MTAVLNRQTLNYLEKKFSVFDSHCCSCISEIVLFEFTNYLDLCYDVSFYYEGP